MKWKFVFVTLLLGALGFGLAAGAAPSKLPIPWGVAKQFTVTGPTDLQGTLGVTGASTFTGEVIYTPTDTVPSLAEGVTYWDDSENSLKIYNGSGWVAVSAGSGDNTLDNAYDQGGAGAGRTITADTGPVVVTNTDAEAAFLLSLTPTPSGSAALGGLQVTVGANSTEDGIQIVNSGTGDDIQGTSDTWSVDKTGLGTFANVTATSQVAGATASITGSANVGSLDFDNGGQVNNDTNGSITISEASEDLSFGFTSNTVTLATSTGVDTLALGDVDAVTGVGGVTFDAAASTLNLPSDGAADDLTISVTGANDASLVFSSTGTGADALQATTTAGGIDITNGGAAGGEDLDLVSSNASVNVTAAEDVADAIVLTASAGGIDVAATGAAGQDIDVVNTGGSVNISATEAAADAVTIAASTDGGGIDISAQNDIDIAMTNGAAGEDITVSNTGGSVNVTASEDAVDAIVINGSAGGVDILSTGEAGQDIDIASTGGSVNVNGSEDAADAVVISAGAGGIDIAATGEAGQDVDISNTGGSVNITATEDDAEAVYIRENAGTSGGVKIHADQGEGAASIHLLSDAGGITLAAGSGDDILVSSDLDVDAAIVGDGGAAISGMLYTVTDDADGKSVAAAEAQTVQTNDGAVGGGVWNLPEASTVTGMAVTFVVKAAQTLDVNPDDADQILGLTNAVGDAVRNSTVGNTLTLVAVDATNWVVQGSYGTWTDVN